MRPLTVACWKWGALFQASHVNVLRSMLARQLRCDHELVCITDNPTGLDGDIRVVPITQFADTPRCRRRMVQYGQDFAALVGPRFLSIDLDTVLVDDITPLVQRDEPLVAYWIDYAQVFSGSLILMTSGYLDRLFRLFADDPEGFPARVQDRGVASDQAMLNWYTRTMHPPMGQWTTRDGILLYFGDGYGRFEYLGVGPNRTTLPAGTRLVALGSADLPVLTENRFEWIAEHYR